MAKNYKLFRECKGCGHKFEVKHKLRLYCDGCRSIVKPKYSVRAKKEVNALT